MNFSPREDKGVEVILSKTLSTASVVFSPVRTGVSREGRWSQGG